jgi:DNA/RNA-binding domain of Phe-tRNA-synthetase-like protein
LALFAYSSEIVGTFPAIRGGVIHATTLRNSDSPQVLIDSFSDEQEAVLTSLGDTPLSGLPSIVAWRRTFSAFGVKPTQYRSAIEALLRRLTKQGDIPSINTLVDIANLVSIRHRLPVAVFDQTSVTGGTVVRFATGDEVFTDLGSGTIANPDKGEVIFADDVGLVSARRWCWRQSRESAAGPETTEAVITVEGLHDGADGDVRRATADLLELLSVYQPQASTRSALLSPAAPGMQ